MRYKKILDEIRSYLFDCSSNPSHTLTEHGIKDILQRIKGYTQYEAEEVFFNLYTMGFIEQVINSNHYPEYVIF